VPITHGLGAALISTKALKKVDPGDIQILLEVARPLLRQLTERTRTQNQEAIAEMRKEGVQTVKVDAATRAEFFKTGREAWADGVGRLYSQEILDRVENLLAEYRKGHANSQSQPSGSQSQ
jgi:TRAP-type C4-dicarboxylate transport system substrate-binding protein